MRVSVIISTFNSETLLERVLAGYERQSYRDFELIVADDGSREPTFEMLARLDARLTYELRHVWHEDDGFRKCTILNRAIAESTGEYLVFSDGDCIPWEGFLGTHVALARPGFFLSGGYFKMSRELSERVTVNDVLEGRVEDLRWLRDNGLEGPWYRRLRLGAPSRLRLLLDLVTPTRPSWNGHNASGWREDLVAVNGFDERMGWGGEDRELGERLVHHGIVGRQIRNRAICMHLWHTRGYVREDVLARNAKIRRRTATSRAAYTDFGIEQ